MEFRGYPVKGDETLLQKNPKAVICLGFDRSVLRVFFRKNVKHNILDTLHADWFSPADKGTCSVYLVGDDGRIYAGVAFFIPQHDFDHFEPHVHLEECNSIEMW